MDKPSQISINVISLKFKYRKIEDMQTRSLETLVKVSQVQSFSEAAELQGMTLSALSMQMKALETELAVELFDRSSRPPRLTPMGLKIAKQAQNVIEQTQALKNLALPSDSLTGHFNLGFIQSAGVRILPEFIHRANGEAPKASFQFMSGLSEYLTELVASSRLDAAVVTQTTGLSADLHYDIIESEELVLLVPLAHSATAIDALPDVLTFIHFMPSTGIGKLIAKRLKALNREPAKVLVLDNIEAAVECVKLGLGYTILPLPDVKRYRNEDVFIHPPGPSRIDRNLSLVTRRDAQTNRWRHRIWQLLKT